MGKIEIDIEALALIHKEAHLLDVLPRKKKKRVKKEIVEILHKMIEDHMNKSNI